MLSSRIHLFDNASLDALSMLYICIYMNYVLLSLPFTCGGNKEYYYCLLGNQLKFQLQPFGCKRARAPIT